MPFGLYWLSHPFKDIFRAFSAKFFWFMSFEVLLKEDILVVRDQCFRLEFATALGFRVMVEIS